MLFRKCGINELEVALAKANEKYAGNLRLHEVNRRGSGVRATLRVNDSRASGARMSASGRHINAASWHAHRDFFKALFDLCPDLVVVTAMATYRGKAGFERDYPVTYHRNVGSMMEPAVFGELSIL